MRAASRREPSATRAYDRELAELFAEYAGPSTPGASVVVARRGVVVLARAFGLADIGNGVPVTTTAAFRLASVTKQFTAAAVLALMEAGHLGLDDSLDLVLPSAPRYTRNVCVRHLLTHTSGIPDYESLLVAGDGPQLTDQNVLELLRQAEGLYFRPGTEWRYSNSAYALLALIVERVSSQSFARYLRQRIFDRAGMPNAVAYVNGIDTIGERAYGHTLEGGVWRRTDQSRTSAVLGDGGVYASAEELAAWSAALDRNAVLQAATFEAATTPAVLESGTSTQYGFGWFLDSYRGVRRQRHEGDSIGFRTSIQRYPDESLTVVVLVNRTQAPIESLSDNVADLFLNE